LNNELLDKKQLKKELIMFLIITFAATYILELIGIYLFGAKILSNKLMIIPMNIPAVAVIFCMFYFKSTAITKEVKIFYILFLLSISVMLFEGIYHTILGKIGPFNLLSTIFALATSITILILNLQKKSQLVSAKLSFGKNSRYYLSLSVIFSTLFIAGLIISNKLGLSLPTKEFNLNVFFTYLGIYILSFVISWPLYFGEEYGWRFYLQDRLFTLYGSYKGVILVGIIWGLWHLPLSLMGMNFPDEPILGNLIYLMYTIIMGIIFSFAVLKTGSIWIAVLLHALTDSIVTTGYLYIAHANKVIAFIPIVVLLGVFALLLLRSKSWTNNEIFTGTELPNYNAVG